MFLKKKSYPDIVKEAWFYIKENMPIFQTRKEEDLFILKMVKKVRPG